MYTHQKLVSIHTVARNNYTLSLMMQFSAKHFDNCFCSDMWAMGAIMAELLSLRPIFPGAR